MKHVILSVALLFVFHFVQAQTMWSNKTTFRGMIGKYEIVMTLGIPTGGATSCFVIGEYYYVSKKKPIDLCSEDEKIIVERVDGTETGFFVLGDWDKKVGQTLTGNWYTIDKKKSYPVSLKVVAKSRD